MSTHGRERATESFWLLLSYVFFPLALPYANWAQPAVLFYLKSSGPFFDLPLFYFHRLSPSLSFQFSSVQSLSRVRLCDLMNCSTSGLPVHHQLPEFTQTYIHRVSDAIRPSHPLSSPSSPAPNPSQHQSLFQ